MSFYASLHTHSMDLFDSHNEPEELCKKIKELGGVGFALTQHGILTGIEPTRKACEKYELKFVPGCEAYVPRGDKKRHLILLSVDATGYKAISEAVSDSQNNAGYAEMTDEILDKYFGTNGFGHGHVIATSACSGGILAMTLRSNETIQNKIDALEKKRANKGLAPDDKVYLFKCNKQKELENTVRALQEERTGLQKLAGTPFKKRENLVNKLDGEAKASALEKLEQDKNAAEKAAKDLDSLKKEISKTKSQLTKTRRETTELSAKVDLYNQTTAQIERLEAELKPQELLYNAAKEEAKELVNLFGEGFFYIEIQYHGLDNENFVYPQLVSIARELNIPLVATNDIHTIDNSEDELLRRQIIRSKRFGERFEELDVGDDQYYVKTDEELKEWLLKILPEDAVDEGIANIKVVFDRCSVVFEEGTHYPKFPVSDGRTSAGVFYDELRRGIKWRFPDGLSDKYKIRLQKEVKVISEMGYIDYHLIVKDFLEYGRLLSAVPTEKLCEAPLTIPELKAWIKENSWHEAFTIGPGRGSAVGSLVCYLLGITSLDPIKYDLLFERFLNPERVSMPDIDSDISNEVRPYVIKYVQHKYGENSVCNIITFSVEAPKGAIRAASKFYSLKKYNDPQKLLALGDVIARKVSNEPGIAFNTQLGNGTTVYESLLEEFADNEDAINILKWAKVTEGTLKAYGVHAAGVVISDNTDIKEYLPLRYNSKLGLVTTQCDMTTVEEKGLLKMDFLGLRTLDIITETLRNIGASKGITLNILRDIPTDDPVIYAEIFAKGNTNSVFQFESNEMKSMLKRFKPSCFEDLIILVSMFRPGPLQFIDGVIDVKHGAEPEYITPELEPILGKTYGAIVYQEQVMEIFQKLAGYTLGGADQVRRYMSKKKADKLAHEKTIFIDGCAKNGISEDKAERLFEQMNEFAKYAFNKSHAAAYAANAYYTAYLKYYYPAEFLCAAMNWAKTEKIAGLMHEAKMFGVEVLPPDINVSGEKFSVSKDGDIVFGLGAVKSVGKEADAIIAERKNGNFNSFFDFFLRTNINSAAVKALISAGAFDSFCDNRVSMLYVVDEIKEITVKIRDKQAFIIDAERLMGRIDSVKSESEFQILLNELGLKTAAFPKMTNSTRLQKRIENAQNAVALSKDMLAEITLSDYPETLSQRMSGEKEYLGNYVTAHPMDDYDMAEAIGGTSIDKINSDTKKIQGVISEVVIKHRKSDNAEMAFIVLEDLTGRVDVSCFTECYKNYKDLIVEGNVVVVTGHVHEEDEQIAMFAKTLRLAKKKTREFIMDVSSYPEFHVHDEAKFRERYEKENGSVIRFLDLKRGQIRTAKYRVSDDVARVARAI